MKCLICNVETVNGKCPSCKTGGSTKNVEISQSCKVCGGKRERAREIIKNGRNEGWYCYYCWNERENKRFHSVPHTYKTKEEANYHAALVRHYLMPLFYSEEPNYEVIEEKRMAVIYAMKKEDIL